MLDLSSFNVDPDFPEALSPEQFFRGVSSIKLAFLFKFKNYYKLTMVSPWVLVPILGSVIFELFLSFFNPTFRHKKDRAYPNNTSKSKQRYSNWFWAHIQSVENTEECSARTETGLILNYKYQYLWKNLNSHNDETRHCCQKRELKICRQKGEPSSTQSWNCNK